MRYLTKSLYKIGLECPNKLYYIKKEQYANQKQINPFLKVLASGGFQVEQLARLHYPDHKLVKTISGEQYVGFFIHIFLISISLIENQKL